MIPTNLFFRFLLLTLLVAPLGTTHAQGVADQVKNWFMTEFAPIWKDMADADPNKMKKFWAEGFRDHPVDMDSSIWKNTTERWQRNFERYKAEGLRGSTVVDIQVEEISGRAVLIRTIWRDHEQDGRLAEETYCGTYIAGKFKNEWKFTNYFTVECSPKK